MQGPVCSGTLETAYFNPHPCFPSVSLWKAELMKMKEFWAIQLDFMHRWPNNFSSVLSELVTDVWYVKKHFQIKEENILNVI